jgi:hypothetical protein
MCLYTFYPYKCGHQASLREEREWHYFLTKPCTARPEEGEYCRQHTHHCIYLPFTCPECGGPQDPRSSPSELEESKTLIWHIQDREVQEVFGEVNWTGPRTDVQEAKILVWSIAYDVQELVFKTMLFGLLHLRL